MIDKIKSALTVNEKNVHKLFNKAADNHDQIFYINRLGLVDVLSYVKEKDVNLPDYVEAKMSGLARKEKPGRLVAAFSRNDKAVHFYLNPKSDEQLENIKSLISSVYLKNDNHQNLLSHLKVVRELG